MTTKGSVAPLLAILTALLACKKKEEQALPDALPEPVTTQAEPVPVPGPAPTPAAADEPDKPSPSTAKPATKRDAGTTADSGTAAKADAGATPSPSAACFQKCQSILQACLTPSQKDGGFPSLGDPAKCQAELQACQTACK
jgi:hypothetical protein